MKTVNEYNKNKRNSFNLFFILFCTLGTAFVVEVVNQQDIHTIFEWLEGHGSYFLLSWLLIIGMYMLLLGVFNNVLISFCLLFGLLFFSSAASFFKMASRGEPLYANDFKYTFKVAGITDPGVIVFDGSLLLGLVFFAFMVYSIIKFKPGVLTFSPHWKINSRVFNLVTGAVVLSITYLSGFFGTTVIKDFSYQTKGFALGLASNIFYNAENEPFQLNTLEYTDKYMVDALNNLKSKTPARIDTKKPNVIIVMSESFFDITRLGLTFSEDPIPNYRELIKNNVHGNIYTTTFGGGTAGVEYEVLTGFLNKYFSQDHSAYESNIETEVMSLASIFRQKGYHSVALHTYDKTFYGRDKAYPLLGFDKFIGLEDLNYPVYKGTFVSDAVLTDMIINEYYKKTQPLFVFAVSMENHQPYNKDKFETNTIKVLDENLSENVAEAVEAYVHGVNDADKELGRLIDFFEKQDEETCILFFGDHLPLLGTRFQLYRETGVLDKISDFLPEDLDKILHTEFVLWSNFKPDIIFKKHFDGADDIFVERIGQNFMGNFLLDYVGGQKPLFYYYIDYVHKSLDYMSREDFVADAKGSLYDKLPRQYFELDELYKLFQYELMYGDNEVKELLMELW